MHQPLLISGQILKIQACSCQLVYFKVHLTIVSLANHYFYYNNYIAEAIYRSLCIIQYCIACSCTLKSITLLSIIGTCSWSGQSPAGGVVTLLALLNISAIISQQ